MIRTRSSFCNLFTSALFAMGTSKKLRLGLTGLCFIALLFSAGVCIGAAPSYYITNLGTLIGAESYVSGINNSGEICGNSYPPGSERAFLYTGGQMVDLGSLGWSSASAINNLGQITGLSDSHGAEHAFLYSNDQMIDLGTLGGSWSQGDGINDSGQVTGGSDTSGDLAYHAFLYSNDQMIDLGTLGGSWSHGWAVNNSGEVTGGASMSGDSGGAGIPLHQRPDDWSRHSWRKGRRWIWN